MSLNLRYIPAAIWLIVLGMLLSSCRAGSPATTVALTSTPGPTATATQPPTATATVTPLPPTAVLLAADGADQAHVDSLQTALNDIVAGAGLLWQVRHALSPADLTPALRLVVVVPPVTNLSSLVASEPKTEFLALGISGLEPAPNLTQIDVAGARPDQQGFIAGVIAAMLSPDWRVGAISLSDTVEGRAARTGFLNGVEYFCGLCRPAHPPFYEYPLYVELPTTATSAEWQEAANYMVDHYAKTVYVYPEAGDEAMLSILAQAEINIISSGEPPEAAKSSWALSLTTDPFPLIQNQVAGLLNGTITGGQSIMVPLQFTNINPGIFTPGKQRLAGELLSDLESGYIDTGVDLSTGEFPP